MFRYRIYGLTVAAPVALPGFIAGSPTDVDAPAWHVTLPGPVARSGAIIRAGDGVENDDAMEVRRPAPDVLGIHFGDGTSFVVDAQARTIVGNWPRHFSFEDALVYLVGPVLGAAVRLEGRTILHASAVRGRAGALLLMGEAGAGKSTLTAALLKRRVALVSEDVSAFTFAADRPAVFRGGARVKLWEDSVTALHGAADAMPRLVPTSADWHKRFVAADFQMAAEDVLPLERVLLVTRDDSATHARIEPLDPQQRALLLIANAYGSYFVDRAHRGAELSRLTDIARSTEVQRLVMPDGWSRLAEGVDLVASLCQTSTAEHAARA